MDWGEAGGFFRTISRLRDEPRGRVRRFTARPLRASSGAAFVPRRRRSGDDAGQARAQQEKGRGPKRPGARIEGRAEQDEVAIALAEEGADFGVAVAGRDALAHERAHVGGDVGGGLRDRLVLALHAADFALERLRARFLRGIGERGGRDGGDEEQRRGSCARSSCARERDEAEQRRQAPSSARR